MLAFGDDNAVRSLQRNRLFIGSTAEITVRPGWLLKGQIATLLDKGYQKFLKAGHTEIPATAENLSTLHKFSEELKETMGALVLYNEALGTTSDKYWYDRVLGRA